MIHAQVVPDLMSQDLRETKKGRIKKNGSKKRRAVKKAGTKKSKLSFGVRFSFVFLRRGPEVSRVLLKQCRCVFLFFYERLLLHTLFVLTNTNTNQIDVQPFRMS